LSRKYFGVIQKIPEAGSVIANYAAGAQFKVATLPRSVVRECVTLCQQQGIDIGGVDLAKVGKNFYLLEVNRCPEFKAFTKATGIDVAGKIVEFALQK